MDKDEGKGTRGSAGKVTDRRGLEVEDAASGLSQWELEKWPARPLELAGAWVV